jgi:hypothetical protein
MQPLQISTLCSNTTLLTSDAFTLDAELILYKYLSNDNKQTINYKLVHLDGKQ